jgi:hypothetical protein
MMKFVLLVSWIFGGVSMHSYQVEFANGVLCDNALVQLHTEASVITKENEAKVGTKVMVGNTVGTIASAGPSPRLLAACVQTK